MLVDTDLQEIIAWRVELALEFLGLQVAGLALDAAIRPTTRLDAFDHFLISDAQLQRRLFAAETGLADEQIDTNFLAGLAAEVAHGHADGGLMTGDGQWLAEAQAGDGEVVQTILAHV